jgi:hypothetical protein
LIVSQFAIVSLSTIEDVRRAALVEDRLAALYRDPLAVLIRVRALGGHEQHLAERRAGADVETGDARCDRRVSPAQISAKYSVSVPSSKPFNPRLMLARRPRGAECIVRFTGMNTGVPR